MKPHPRDNRIVEEAAAWVAELRDLDPQRRTELAAWLMESPRHLEQFFLMAELDTQLGEIDEARVLEIPESVVLENGENIVALRSDAPATRPLTLPSPRKRGEGKMRRFALAAACGLLAILAGWALNTYPAWYGYSTSVGEIRSFKLPDGSVMLLNTRSRVKVDFTAQERRFQLLEGEALFTVERDPQRPFRVLAGDALIQALGTQFNVYRKPDAITVSVLEGAVGISKHDGAEAVELEAGREANILPHGEIAPPAPLKKPKVVAWQQRRLLFKEDTLADIAAEFNRYNSTPQIRLIDSSVASLRLSGVFDTDAPEALLLFLEKVNALSVERTRTEVRIRAGGNNHSPNP